jgi:Lon protease-like protein
MTTPTPLRPIPLFPLGTVLFPGGFLPLRVFEVRYLDMVGKCHKTGEPFGVVCLTQGSEVRKPGAEAEAFATIGTLAAIREFNSPQAGLMQIECVGTQRFRIHASEQQKHGLWTAEVATIADDLPVAVPADLRHVSDALQRLINSLEERRRQQATPGVRLPMLAPYRLDDCGWVANRWCELLPAKPELKQRLMELDSPLMRLELISDLLARTGIVT